MGVEDNLFQIGSLDQTDTFYDWFNKTNNEIIAKLNNLTVYSGLSGDGINVLVGTTSGSGTSGVMEVSITDSITKGVTFQGDVTINGLLNYTSGLNLPTGFRFYSGPSGGTSGFTFGNPVRVISYDGGVAGGTSGIGLTLANSSNGTNGEAIGLVKEIGSNYIDVIMNGDFTLSDWSGALDTGNTLNAGCVYFLSTTSGKLTKTEPTTIGLVSKPILLGISGDRGGVLHYRGQLLQQGMSGATASTAAINSFVVDLGYDPDVAANGIGSTQLEIGCAVSKKRKSASYSGYHYFPVEYSNPSGFSAGTGGPTAEARRYYGGYYLTSAVDADILPDPQPVYDPFTFTFKVTPSRNEFIGIIKSYPGGTYGTLMEIVTSGVFNPSASNIADPLASALDRALYITTNDVYIPPTTPLGELWNQLASAGQYTSAQTSILASTPLDENGTTHLLTPKLFFSQNIATTTESLDPVTENMARNGSFDFWQREVGTSVAATGGTSDNGFFFADSWAIVNGISSGNSASTGQFQIERKSFTKGQVEVLGEPNYYARYSSTLSGITGNTGSFADYVWVENRIPDSTIAANEPSVISFYAKSDTAGVNMDVYYNQYWSNGSKAVSSYYNEQKIGTVQLSTQWQRYLLPVRGVTPSSLVTGDDNYSSIAFDMVDLGSGYVDLAQLIFEKGSFARKPVKIDYEKELAKAQSLYQKSYTEGVKPGSATMSNPLQADISPVIFAADSSFTHYFKFPARTKSTPTVVIYSPKSGIQSDGLNLSATNSYEALDMRLTSGSSNLNGTRRNAITGNPTLSTTVSKEGFILDLLGGVLVGDKIAIHYVADADINKNFKRT